jgi:cobalt/nickel transport system permease protein
MFIRSRDMAEEMNQAMECRGFTGEYSIKQRFSFSVYDFVFILITIAMILVFVYFWGISK